jgi:hypothetical protein
MVLERLIFRQNCRLEKTPHKFSTKPKRNRNAMLWDIPYTKNSNVIPRNSVFIKHALRPP